MIRNSRKTGEDSGARFLSIDLFRGVVMFFLIAEATGLYDMLVAPAFGRSIVEAIGLQFRHHPWNGLRLWDLGQPFFMFISGAAMFLSYTKRWASGLAWKDTLFQAARRSFVLFALGWAISRIAPVEAGSHTAFLYDILPQLAVSSFVAFLILRRPVRIQLALSFGLLALTELFYRTWAFLKHSQPYLAGDNFGSFFDRIILGGVSGEHWVAFDVVPLTAFVIWGMLAGRWLAGPVPMPKRLRVMVLFGLGGIATGLVLSPFTPIVRRIATSSFVLFGGGACLLALALAYWLADILKAGKGATIFLAIGMNPLFIYLFAQTGGAGWLGRLAFPFANGIVGWAGEWAVEFAAALMTQALMCGLCYVFYRKRVFIRI
jgi:predicted acyltransferase